jgi:hypothetical protein
MKRLLRLPRLKTMSLALFLIAGVIIISETACAPKPDCGSKRDHRVRKRRVHKFAPAMGYINPANAKEFFFV